MKLILIFGFLALICMARTAPTPSSTSRELILPDYHDENDHEDKIHTDIDNNHDDDEDEDGHPTTTIRSTPAFPSRNPGLIPTRRPIRTQRTSSIQTTSVFDVDDDDIETVDEYNGDYRHFQDLRKYLQQIVEEFRKMVRKIMGSDFGDTSQQDSINQHDH